MLITGILFCIIALCVSLWLGNLLSLKAYEKLQIAAPEWALTARILIFISTVLLIPGLILLMIITAAFIM
jgi:hypothetical protein